VTASAEPRTGHAHTSTSPGPDPGDHEHREPEQAAPAEASQPDGTDAPPEPDRSAPQRRSREPTQTLAPCEARGRRPGGPWPRWRWATLSRGKVTPLTVSCYTHLAADFRRIAQRRGTNKARVAVARKVLTLVYFGLRDGEIRCLAQARAAA
jgi:hypothetical protein